MDLETVIQSEPPRRPWAHRHGNSTISADPSWSSEWNLGGQRRTFICKAIAGHKGEIDELACISTKEYWFDGREKSVVCTVSSDGTVCAWDLQEGTEICRVLYSLQLW
ncbi:F-box/WD repeat-containing protein 12 [Eschrichtius robustus]|uniref:F-box/WD repeat-containing protein 12 n=1 Tax=Eschrichtius robustus TaxID=9764 RepID=UPI0035C240DA